MTQVTITAPNPKYDGISAGVKFTDGKATIEIPRQRAALEYFERHRFGISKDVAAPEGEGSELAVTATGNPQPGAVPAGAAAPASPASGDSPEAETEASLGKLTREQLDALAAERSIDISGAGNKSDVIALLLAAPAVVPAPGQPADVAGEGPAGAQNNVGHDGADPGNVGTPTTPTDATI